MVSACDRAGDKLFVVKQNRYNVQSGTFARRSMPGALESSFSEVYGSVGVGTRRIMTKIHGEAPGSRMAGY